VLIATTTFTAQQREYHCVADQSPSRACFNWTGRLPVTWESWIGTTRRSVARSRNQRKAGLTNKHPRWEFRSALAFYLNSVYSTIWIE